MTYFDKKIAAAKAVIEGEKDDVHFLPFLYEIDSEQEILQDESTWEKTNPLLNGAKMDGENRKEFKK